ncbi:MAG: adenylate/guanylate cyclase domain-containing protein [Abitibacteriaceae bacterium]|nr:adenylate/guanylate cyclase domain-containing protein [Abditibacteriaceae bacterium]
MNAHKHRFDGRLLTLLFIALAVPSLSPILVARAPAVRQLELLFYDWYYHTLPRRRPDPRIVLVRMDDASLAHLPLASAAYPLPRQMHAQIVDKLRQAGAMVIGFDESFSRSVPAEDKSLVAALQRQGKVVVALEPSVNEGADANATTFLPPAPSLRASTIAAVDLFPRQLGRVRWFMPYAYDAISHKQYSHFAIALATAYLGAGDATSHNSEQNPLEPINVTTGDRGEVLIRYSIAPGRFASVPYSEVYNGTWEKMHDRDFFTGKIVIIGSPAALAERVDTPGGVMSALEVQANATQTVLQGSRLRHWSRTAAYLVSLLFCLSITLVIWQWGLQGGLYIIVGEAMLWMIMAQQLLLATGLWIDTVQPLATLVVTYLLTSATEVYRMRRVLQRVMPSWVAKEMMAANPNDARQTEEVEAAVIFCDVRSYTSLCESLPSQTIEELLRRYFTAAEQAARRWGTEIDKFVGDEIMLYYVERRKGWRPGQESVSQRAIRWALAMQEAMATINASGLAGEIGFRVGIGISTGVVRIGTVGGQQRIQHTLIGDAVNTASRLQEMTKELGCHIIISESTYEQAMEHIEVKALGEVYVKGKQHPLKIYCPVKIVESEPAKT